MKPYAILLPLILAACKDSTVTVDHEYDGTYRSSCDSLYEIVTQVIKGSSSTQTVDIYQTADCSGTPAYTSITNSTLTIDQDSSEVAGAKNSSSTLITSVLTFKAQQVIDDLNSRNVDMCGHKPAELNIDYDVSTCALSDIDFANPSQSWIPTLSFYKTSVGVPKKDTLKLTGNTLCYGDRSDLNASGYPKTLLTDCLIAQ